MKTTVKNQVFVVFFGDRSVEVFSDQTEANEKISNCCAGLGWYIESSFTPGHKEVLAGAFAKLHNGDLRGEINGRVITWTAAAVAEAKDI